MQQQEQSLPPFKLGQRVHTASDPRRIGTVKYVGAVEGYSGTWVGVDWDDNEGGKHDGSINGIRYFNARSEKSGSFVRSQNLSSGILLLEALRVRYQTESTKEELDEMYVLSARNNRVSVELLGKEKIQDKVSRFEELTGASLSYLGVSTPGSSEELRALLPSLKELDLTGNLLSDWKDVGIICEQLPVLTALNVSNNLLSHEVTGLPQLKCIRILVLNNTGIKWTQVEMLKSSIPSVEELHLKGNSISTIESKSLSAVEGFDSLRVLDLDDNCFADWNEIIKLSQLKSLEQLYLNKNSLSNIFYPSCESPEKSYVPFQNLFCLLLGCNKIDDLTSVDSLNFFPKLTETRLSENPITDTGKGGIPRFVLIARLVKIEMLNGSEVRARERKESEIRYVRLVMSKLQDTPDEIKRLHPRFAVLKVFYGIEDQKPSIGAAGPQKMASGLLSITLKCVAASMGEKAPLTKKLPATTTVGKLKSLCESFFKLKSVRPKLFLQEEGSPLPTLLNDEIASLADLGVGNESIILVDEDS